MASCCRKTDFPPARRRDLQITGQADIAVLRTGSKRPPLLFSRLQIYAEDGERLRPLLFVTNLPVSCAGLKALYIVAECLIRSCQDPAIVSQIIPDDTSFLCQRFFLFGLRIQQLQ